MNRPTRLRMGEVTPHILCVLCGGYLIDATTIMECLHSFCKSCITRYLEASKYCPICDVMVHKTKPLLNLRPDKTLQDLVYKLVPSVFKDEMNRRREFYRDNPNADLAIHGAHDSEARGQVPDERFHHVADERISLCLQHVNRLPPYNNPSSLQLGATAPTPRHKKNDRRFLLCPAGVAVSHLKKFVRCKFDLPPEFQVEVVHTDEPLPDDYTLLDVAGLYGWTRDSPLLLYYFVYDKTKTTIHLPGPTTMPSTVNQKHTIKNRSRKRTNTFPSTVSGFGDYNDTDAVANSVVDNQDNAGRNDVMDTGDDVMQTRVAGAESDDSCARSRDSSSCSTSSESGSVSGSSVSSQESCTYRTVLTESVSRTSAGEPVKCSDGSAPLMVSKLKIVAGRKHRAESTGSRHRAESTGSRHGWSPRRSVHDFSSDNEEEVDTRKVTPIKLSLDRELQQLKVVSVRAPTRPTTPPRSPVWSTTPPRSTTPSRTPPRSTTPSRTPPRSTTPSRTPPRSTTPSRTPPRSTTPSRTPPRSTTPSHTPPRSTTPSRTPPRSTTPSRTPPRSTTPSHTPPRSTTPSRTPPRSTTPSHTPPRSTTPSRTPTRPTTPVRIPPRPATPSWTQSHPTTPPRALPTDPDQNTMDTSDTEDDLSPEPMSVDPQDMDVSADACDAPVTVDPSSDGGTKAPIPTTVDSDDSLYSSDSDSSRLLDTPSITIDHSVGGVHPVDPESKDPDSSSLNDTGAARTRMDFTPKQNTCLDRKRSIVSPDSDCIIPSPTPSLTTPPALQPLTAPLLTSTPTVDTNANLTSKLPSVLVWDDSGYSSSLLDTPVSCLTSRSPTPVHNAKNGLSKLQPVDQLHMQNTAVLNKDITHVAPHVEVVVEDRAPVTSTPVSCGASAVRRQNLHKSLCSAIKPPHLQKSPKLPKYTGPAVTDLPLGNVTSSAVPVTSCPVSVTSHTVCDIMVASSRPPKVVKAGGNKPRTHKESPSRVSAPILSHAIAKTSAKLPARSNSGAHVTDHVICSPRSLHAHAQSLPPFSSLASSPPHCGATYGLTTSSPSAHAHEAPPIKQLKMMCTGLPLSQLHPHPHAHLPQPHPALTHPSVYGPIFHPHAAHPGVFLSPSGAPYTLPHLYPRAAMSPAPGPFFAPGSLPSPGLPDPGYDLPLELTTKKAQDRRKAAPIAAHSRR